MVLGAGKFFGEGSLLTGRKRTATVRARDVCLLIEPQRRTMLKLIHSYSEVKRAVDEASMLRALQTGFLQDVSPAAMRATRQLVKRCELVELVAGQVLFNEGDDPDGLYLIQSGSVMVSTVVAGEERVIAYVQAGHYVGEMGLVRRQSRSATVTAAYASTLVKIGVEPFDALWAEFPSLRERLSDTIRTRAVQTARRREESSGQLTRMMNFLFEQGLGDGTDVLLIDEGLCIGCDNCEDACAATHGGTSRLDREAGPSYAHVHVPTSCRHCEHPHCMKDCPPDAIHRNVEGEVYIDETCIGCGNCERNCPYGVIHMASSEPQPQPNLL